MRLFIATDLPPAIVESVSGIREAIDPGGSYARWVRPESLHLTLKFLGWVDPARIERIDRALERIRRAAFNVAVSGVGFFPNDRSPRVFWVGISSDGLEQLARDIENRMVEAGFPPEERAFAPHLTLARGPKKGRIDPRLVQEVRPLTTKEFGTFNVDRYCLYHSVLERSGASHTKLRSYELAGPDDSGRPIP